VFMLEHPIEPGPITIAGQPLAGQLCGVAHNHHSTTASAAGRAEGCAKAAASGDAMQP
jgi:hypothetical protein